MADNSSFIENGMQHAQRAIKADREACSSNDPDQYNEAYRGYMRCIEHFMTALKYEKNDKTKSILTSKLEEYMGRAEVMKGWLDDYEADATGGGGGGGASTTAKRRTKGGTKKKGSKHDGNGEDGENDEDKKMRAALQGAIVSEKPNVKWDDVAGLEGAKEALKEAVILPMRFPNLFTGNRKPWKGILMYGPPGTGKSYLAKAVATEADAKFFSVSSADLVSKWQGESEKLVRELFRMAREAGRAIVFIDEIDSLASSRSDSESESARRIKTEFLVQMQGVGNNSDGVLVLGATNIPWGLDSAIRRRFERRIYIPLPDFRARARMFEIHLGTTPHTLRQPDYGHLGKKSDGYSGSDINVLVRDAIMQPVRTLQNAQYFKQVSVPDEKTGQLVTKWSPCSPGDPAAEPMTLMGLRPEQEVFVPPVSRYDFDKALASSKPSVGTADIQKHVQFTKDFGQEGN
ncbi:hypothetical protein BU14_0104s0025 [Porphyra umbilicalis]|uniref:Vesicle-fusing ATPase n=1 Tax=Porphyra umbilicalis TaxID=2786 RepID=A0A1X6PCP1_PORUM|nr:hypothetical protein BU14_0104s0025 [Porphyra umbilicalis]|eukprot:OSX78651.1 hypothetical protein BU14_0104s0025 [Porphyra umbilicalis]